MFLQMGTNITVEAVFSPIIMLHNVGFRNYIYPPPFSLLRPSVSHMTNIGFILIFLCKFDFYAIKLASNSNPVRYGLLDFCVI